MTTRSIIHHFPAFVAPPTNGRESTTYSRSAGTGSEENKKNTDIKRCIYEKTSAIEVENYALSLRRSQGSRYFSVNRYFDFEEKKIKFVLKLYQDDKNGKKILSDRCERVFDLLPSCHATIGASHHVSAIPPDEKTGLLEHVKRRSDSFNFLLLRGLECGLFRPKNKLSVAKIQEVMSIIYANREPASTCEYVNYKTFLRNLKVLTQYIPLIDINKYDPSQPPNEGFFSDGSGTCYYYSAEEGMIQLAFKKDGKSDDKSNKKKDSPMSHDEYMRDIHLLQKIVYDRFIYQCQLKTKETIKLFFVRYVWGSIKRYLCFRFQDIYLAENNFKGRSDAIHDEIYQLCETLKNQEVKNPESSEEVSGYRVQLEQLNKELLDIIIGNKKNSDNPFRILSQHKKSNAIMQKLLLVLKIYHESDVSSWDEGVKVSVSKIISHVDEAKGFVLEKRWRLVIFAASFFGVCVPIIRYISMLLSRVHPWVISAAIISTILLVLSGLTIIVSTVFMINGVFDLITSVKKLRVFLKKHNSLEIKEDIKLYHKKMRLIAKIVGDTLLIIASALSIVIQVCGLVFFVSIPISLVFSVLYLLLLSLPVIIDYLFRKKYRDPYVSIFD